MNRSSSRGSMRKHTWFLVLYVCALGGCRQARLQAHMQGKSQTTLYNVCTLVDLVESESKEPAPVELPELVDWLSKHGGGEESYIDYRQGTIRDAWGHSLVVIAESGKFVGLGSPGPDGRWENGKGDDIIVTLEEVKQ